MFCEKCGTQLNETDRFCYKCGAEIRPTPIVYEERPVKPVEPVAPPVEEAPVFTAPPVEEAPVFTAPPVQPETPEYTAPEAPDFTAPPMQQEQPAFTAQEAPVFFAPPVQPEQPVYSAPVQPQGYQQPTVAPAPVKKETPLFVKNMLETLKKMKNPAIAVIEAADNTTPEGGIFLGAYVLLFAFAAAVNIAQFVGFIFRTFILRGMGTALGMFGGNNATYLETRRILNRLSGIIFGNALGATILSRIMFVAILFGVTWLILLIVCKKKVNVFSLMNVLGTALLIPTVLTVINFFVGFIPVPFTVIGNLLASMVFVVLFYDGTKKLALRKDSTFFLTFVLILIISVLLLLAFDSIFALAFGLNVSKGAVIVGANSIRGLNIFDMFR